MIKYKIAAAVVATMIFSGNSFGQLTVRKPSDNDFRKALTLYENNMFSEARVLFEDIAGKTKDPQAEGYVVLCSENLADKDYTDRMRTYIEKYPYSGLVPMIHYRHALNLFDNQEYQDAITEFGLAGEKKVGKKDKAEYYYKLAYSRLQTGDNDGARYGFGKIDKMPLNNYSAPARFALGFIDYEAEKFPEALDWFGKSVKDKRFEDISNYYIMECRFMMKDYAYVTKYGEDIFNSVPEDRKSRIARILSEAYLVLGDVASAKKYYDETGEDKAKNRDDYFYAGSLLYAVKDYKGAIENYSRMGDRSDSLGQIANYQMAFSYIQTKNKVAAMDSFKSASGQDFNAEIQEDAFFNYAKLSFDLNNDPSVFDRYIAKYSDKKRGNMIYAYQALSALHSKDYAAAVEVYDKIDELDDDMRANYMKANYLRAEQLIRNGSYRAAVPCLKAASYYAERRSPLNLLSKYWLAETYYRDGKYNDARTAFNDLYNISALDGRQEGSLIPYNIAYCYFKDNNYDMASTWFDKYIAQGKSAVNSKDALLRKADGAFMKADYKKAVELYNQVIEAGNPDDIYPRYQAGIAYGLSGDAKKKAEVLSGIMEASPNAGYYDEAIYELGRTYLDSKQDDNAIKAYNLLLSNSQDNAFVARALLGLGLANRNKGSYDKALEYYKKVVADMPSTDYSNDALAAIESIYQEKQEPEQYLAYVESIGKLSEGGELDMEEMLFNGAEKVFLAGNYTKALASLGSYEEKYPDGKHMDEVNFYIAESYRNTDNKDKACDYYKKVMAASGATYAEVSAVNYSRLCYDMERFQDAFDGYGVLMRIARIDANKHTAAIGLMRSAFRAKGFKNAILYSGSVADDKEFNADEKREARYIMAKSYLASSQRDKAFAILKELAVSKSTPEGAEAEFMLIQDSYDRGDFKDVEKLVFEFSDSGSSQTYWMARSFIILGDSYVENGDFKQARATFESIRDGYSPAGDSDGVLDEVKMRLGKLDEMGK